MRAKPSATTILFAGLTGGLAVGFYDGFGASLRAGVGGLRWFPAAVLCGSVGALLGLGAAILVVVLGAVSHWGRRQGAPRPAAAAAWVLLGLVAVAVITAAVAGTATR